MPHPVRAIQPYSNFNPLERFCNEYFKAKAVTTLLFFYFDRFEHGNAGLRDGVCVVARLPRLGGAGSGFAKS